LLALFCLNIIGYRMVARYYAGKSSADMQITLDQQKFRESDLVRFKIPLNQPYIINSDGYESIEGNMDYKGVNYQFVKKRILNDTLEIVCIPNITRTQIYNNEEDLAKLCQILFIIINLGSSYIWNTNNFQSIIQYSFFNKLIVHSLVVHIALYGFISI